MDCCQQRRVDIAHPGVRYWKWVGKFTIARNTGGARTGTVTVAGKTLTIAQRASTCGAADIAQLVSVSKSGFAPIPMANWITGTLRIKNTSSSAITGPIYTALVGLPRGTGRDAVDVMQTGTIPKTYCFSTVGDYLFPLTPGQFASGQTLTLTLSIVLPSYVASPN